MTDFAGRRLGKYEILGLLGKGGFATVYRARQTDLGREVALKVMKASLAESEDFLARFRREAHLIAQLDHPHIMTIYEYGQEGETVYLAMRLLTGGSLADRLRQHGPLPVEEARRITHQIASALSLAHGRGVIHRDLKPQNVLFDGSGSAVLTDFGIAKVDSSSTLVTGTGVAMGTALVYVAGAVARRTHRSTRGYLRAWADALRDAERQAAFPWRYARQLDVQTPD